MGAIGVLSDIFLRLTSRTLCDTTKRRKQKYIEKQKYGPPGRASRIWLRTDKFGERASLPVQTYIAGLRSVMDLQTVVRAFPVPYA